MVNISDDEKSNLRLHHIRLRIPALQPHPIPKRAGKHRVTCPGRSQQTKRRQRAYELLERFGLTRLAERFPETLSGGERQRVAVIRALANSPKIILADEPTSSLDDENSELLSQINRERKVTIVLTTTDLHGKTNLKPGLHIEGWSSRRL
jgi:ABC-type lipoprotein export system ATPase subunit